MPPKKKRPKATKSPPEVWVSPDLMRKLKGADEHRAGPMPHSPYLALADHFLGVAPGESAPSKSAHRALPGHGIHKTRESTPAPEPPRALAAAAAAGASSASSETMLSSVPPRVLYPKPPSRPAAPRPPKLSISGLPARPSPPKLHPPKPPKMSFGYRRAKVDRAK